MNDTILNKGVDDIISLLQSVFVNDKQNDLYIRLENFIQDKDFHKYLVKYITELSVELSKIKNIQPNTSIEYIVKNVMLVLRLALSDKSKVNLAKLYLRNNTKAKLFDMLDTFKPESKKYIFSFIDSYKLSSEFLDEYTNNDTDTVQIPNTENLKGFLDEYNGAPKYTRELSENNMDFYDDRVNKENTSMKIAEKKLKLIPLGVDTPVPVPVENSIINIVQSIIMNSKFSDLFKAGNEKNMASMVSSLITWLTERSHDFMSGLANVYPVTTELKTFYEKYGNTIFGDFTKGLINFMKYIVDIVSNNKDVVSGIYRLGINGAGILFNILKVLFDVYIKYGSSVINSAIKYAVETLNLVSSQRIFMLVQHKLNSFFNEIKNNLDTVVLNVNDTLQSYIENGLMSINLVKNEVLDSIKNINKYNTKLISNDAENNAMKSVSNVIHDTQNGALNRFEVEISRITENIEQIMSNYTSSILNIVNYKLINSVGKKNESIMEVIYQNWMIWMILTLVILIFAIMYFFGYM